MPSLDPRLPVQSPTRVLALVLLLVFAVEGAIMLCFPRLLSTRHDQIQASLLDASLLTLIVAPAVWYLAIAPLRRLFEARGHLLRRLFESQEQERVRIARDLHDSLGQQLTALMVGLRTVEEADNLETARARAHDLRELASASHGEVRRLAHGLQPALLEELGLVSAIERLCEDFESSHGLHVVMRGDGARATRVSPGTENALYRIAQEALTNVARHADASQVEVDLAYDDGRILLAIRDDGRGFGAGDAAPSDPREGGYGLGSIRERTLMLGGELAVRTRPGGGTTIEVRMPADG